MLLEMADVSRTYRGRGAGFTLFIPQLTVAPGEIIVIVGPSGSGKSTLLDLLAFLAAPDLSGRFRFRPGAGQDHDIAALWRRSPAQLNRLRGRYIGYVLQTGGLLPYLSVRENLLLPCRLLHASPRIDDLARVLGIAGHMQRTPNQLSIGERQRVAIARALAHGPALVLADEPTAALDAGLAMVVADAMVEAARQVGSALVVVTHDIAVADRVGGRRIMCRPDPAARTATVGQ
jgi:putative ABC transport system ATP-binding protein